MAVDLFEKEALLNDRERICLAGYLMMKDSDDKAMMKAYVYSRSYPVQDEIEVIRKKTEKWFNTPQVKAYLALWEAKGEQARQQQPKHNASVDVNSEEDARMLSATEEIIKRYEELYKEADNIEDRAKILKMIVDTRHKNKDDVKEESKIAQIYLPLRCSECVLYKQEQAKAL